MYTFDTLNKQVLLEWVRFPLRPMTRIHSRQSVLLYASVKHTSKQNVAFIHDVLITPLKKHKETKSGKEKFNFCKYKGRNTQQVTSNFNKIFEKNIIVTVNVFCN